MQISRCLSGLLFLAFAPALFAVDWQPLNPTDLALKQSKTDPNADVEALFRQVWVGSEQHGEYVKNIVSEYVRIKVYTDRGKEFGNVQIQHFGSNNVFNVAGRTIHSNGTITELTKDSIFEKVLEKRGLKTKVISFAMPAIEPGCIFEYKFSKTEGDDHHYYGTHPLEVQSEYPVDELTFYIKPLPSSMYPPMRYMPFGCKPEVGQVTHDGYSVLKVKDIPAYHEERYSPPEHSSKQWILIYYEDNEKVGKDKFWTSLGKERYKRYIDQVKVNGETKDIAAQITAGATNDDEKLAKILSFCRTQIKDVGGDSITTAELDKAKPNHNSLDTIRRKEGDKFDIQMAFLALAQGAGFDARRVDLADRATFLFGPDMQSQFFLNAADIAVNAGDKWKYFDVTNPAVPPGSLRWQEQGVYALITDNKDPQMVKTPLIPASESVKTRIATLTISEDGTLEGDIREMLSGNEGIGWRERNLHTNDEQRVEAVRESLKHRFADFEATNIKVIANPDASKPVGITYHLVVHRYAQRTGKRLFVEPDFFAANYHTTFPEAARHNAVYFEYPWGELDSVDVTLPPGFDLDHADAPAGLNIPSRCDYSVKIGYDKAHNQIQYRRHMYFGDKDILWFEAKYYPALKQIFDRIHDADNHILTFKNDAGIAPAGQ